MNATALVIGNDHVVADFVARVLERANIDVLRASNGHLGLKMTLAYLPDVVLSDHDMPYCTGLDVLKAIRADRRTCRIPFVSLFSTPSAVLSLQHFLYGADAALASPFGPRSILNTVYDLLKTSRRPSDA